MEFTAKNGFRVWVSLSPYCWPYVSDNTLATIVSKRRFAVDSVLACKITYFYHPDRSWGIIFVQNKVSFCFFRNF